MEGRVQVMPRVQLVGERGNDAGRGEDASCSMYSTSVAGSADGADDVGVLEDGVQVRPSAEP